MAKALKGNRNTMSAVVAFSVTVGADVVSYILGDQAKEEMNYWCKDIKPLGSSKGNTIGLHLLNGGQVFLYENSGKYHQLTIQKLQAGIQKWLQTYPKIFGDVVADVGSELILIKNEVYPSDCDYILQFAIYGNVHTKED